MSELSLISLKNNLRSDVKYKEIITKIITRINELGLNTLKYKLDTELLEFICNSIEYLVKKKDSIDKKKLCLDVFKAVFNNAFSTEDSDSISRNVEYLWNNKRIQKISMYKYLKSNICQWIQKKVL